MAIKVERMTRDFVFNNIHLPDPNPELPIEKVREIHAMTYPEMMYTVIALYGPTASIPFQRYCTSIEAVSPKEAERLVLEEADDELIVAGVLEGEHDMVDEDPTLNPEDAEVASV